MTISLYQNMSPKEKVTKTLTLVKTISGYLRDETSILDPVITIELTGDLTMAVMVQVNYLYIPDFKRYYYITHMRSIRTGLMEISCHVDVLMSWDTFIRQQEAIVQRQHGVVTRNSTGAVTSFDHANLYINDGVFDLYQPRWTVNRVFTGGHPFQENRSHSYVLMLTGVT